jgi:2-polyprenyl-6-methoxyphenol hydroxylase-like FAD-dependent oxidoreductase
VREVVVIGAGISGLAAAKVLVDQGVSVRVFERTGELSRGGAGLTLWPNASQALRSLGMLDGVRPELFAVQRAVTLNPSGRVISEIPLDRMEGRFGRLFSVGREDLLVALRAQVTAPIEFGAEVVFDGGRLVAGGAALRADLIVGADGVGSVVRQFVVGMVSPRPAGYSAWRGVARTDDLTPTAASETWGRGKRFGLVPLTGGRTYWFAVVGGGDPHDDLEREFSGWHEPIIGVLESTPSTERSYLPITDLPRLPRWHRDGVVLVGDAAHAMTPNLGQGAAQALEDVAALSELLRSGWSKDALDGYETQRKRRAERVASQSRAIGRIAQARNPVLAAARDFIAGRVPDTIAARQLASVIRS